DYQRSRLRIARATVLNLFIALPVVVVYLAVRTDAAWWIAAVAAVIALSVLLAELIFRLIEYAYVNRLSDAYRLLKSAPSADPPPRGPYELPCDAGGHKELKFLLVRTKGGDMWTFPKGHRRKGETLTKAALREA